MEVRTAQFDELDAIAKLWFDAWRDAHAEIVPAELVRIRTLENFRARLPDLFEDLRVVGEIGTPIGFSIVKEDELYQLFVSAEARGTGVAKKLIDEVETRLVSNGVRTAWLACAVGNLRAARFYEKSGWHLARNVISELPLPTGIFPLEVWRYEKELTTDGTATVQ